MSGTADANNPSRDATACPLCGRIGDLVFRIDDVPVMQCCFCTHRYAAIVPQADHVRKYYDDDYFFAGKAGYSDYLAGEDLLRRQGKWYAQVLMKQAPQCAPLRLSNATSNSQKTSLFAVGAAAGFDIDEFRKAGWSVSGVEPNETMARHAREVIGIDIQTGTLETIHATQTYDVVTAIQVMAHFTDPQIAAERLSKLVRRGGCLLVETWDYRSLTARIFGRHWHEYSPPTVLQWFSKTSLISLMKRHGLDVAGSGKPAKRIGGAHARSLLEYKLSQMPLSSVTPSMLKLIPKNLTLLYPGDDLFWMLFRKPQ